MPGAASPAARSSDCGASPEASAGAARGDAPGPQGTMPEATAKLSEGGLPRQPEAGRPGRGGDLPLPRLRRLARHLTRGLTRKFSLFLALLLTALTATLTLTSTLAEQQLSEQRLRQRLESTVSLLAALAASHLAAAEPDALRQLLERLAAQGDVLYVYVTDAAGRLVATGSAEGAAAPWPIARSGSDGGRAAGLRLRDGRGLHAAEPITLRGRPAGMLRLGLASATMERDLLALGRYNLLTGLVFLAASLLLGLILVRRITRPLAELTEVALAVSRGQLDRRIRIAGHDEIGLLAAAFNRMLSQLTDSIAQVRRLAYFDSITELPNRLQFRQLLSQSLAEARRHQRRGAVLYLDLDRFKLINDSFGHDAGDRLLQAFARRLGAALRGTDIVARGYGEHAGVALARLGGDEFTILLGDIGRAENAARVARRVLAALDHPFDLDGQAVVVQTSIGIALFPDDAGDAETLLKHADVAMYHAKARGRNNLKFYSSEQGDHVLERLTLERELRIALERHELELHYQPQLDPASGAVLGFEALLRWPHPRLGVLAPGPILKLAEETGLIVPIGTWVLRRVCAQAQAWSAAGLGAPRVAINLSVQQIWQDDFVERLAAVLEAHGLAAGRLELEITETAVASDDRTLGERLAALRGLGVALVVDDFGSGQSSLSALRRFRPDRIKIDRAFVRDIDHDPDAAALVSAIIAMAASLGLEVAAIGVENERQAAFLRERGCRRVQGFLYGPPLPPEAVAAWLQDRGAGAAPTSSVATTPAPNDR